MSQQQPVNIIGLYAKLEIAKERFEAAGKPVPENIIRNLQAIQARAQTTLDPRALQHAMQYVHTEKDRLLNEESALSRRAQVERAERVERDFVKRVTQNVTGAKRNLSLEELDALRRGKFKVDEPVDTDKFFRSATKKLDPRGKGYSRAEYARHMDLLVDASPENFKKYAQGFNATEEDLRAAAKAWEGERDGFRLMERLQRKDNDIREHGKPDVQQKIDPRDELRATIAHNMIDDAAKRQDTKRVGELMDDIPDFILEDEHTRGDVGRAMQEVEEREARGEERYNAPEYTTEVFEVEEDGRSN